MRRVAVGVLLGLAAGALGGCTSCPPSWLDRVPTRDGYVYATGSAGLVYVDADARRVALTRSVRVLADRLGVDVEAYLSVVASPDGRRVIVEARDHDGAVPGGLAAVELVDEARCGDDTHVLVRVAAPAPAGR